MSLCKQVVAGSALCAPTVNVIHFAIPAKHMVFMCQS